MLKDLLDLYLKDKNLAILSTKRYLNKGRSKTYISEHCALSKKTVFIRWEESCALNESIFDHIGTSYLLFLEEISYLDKNCPAVWLFFLCNPEKDRYSIFEIQKRIGFRNQGQTGDCLQKFYSLDRLTFHNDVVEVYLEQKDEKTIFVDHPCDILNEGIKLSDLACVDRMPSFDKFETAFIDSFEKVSSANLHYKQCSSALQNAISIKRILNDLILILEANSDKSFRNNDITTVIPTVIPGILERKITLPPLQNYTVCKTTLSESANFHYPSKSLIEQISIIQSDFNSFASTHPLVPQTRKFSHFYMTGEIRESDLLLQSIKGWLHRVGIDWRDDWDTFISRADGIRFLHNDYFDAEHHPRVFRGSSIGWLFTKDDYGAYNIDKVLDGAYDFSKSGYNEEKGKEEKMDLKIIKPIIDEWFDFGKKYPKVACISSKTCFTPSGEPKDGRIQLLQAIDTWASSIGEDWYEEWHRFLKIASNNQFLNGAKGNNISLSWLFGKNKTNGNINIDNALEGFYKWADLMQVSDMGELTKNKKDGEAKSTISMSMSDLLKKVGK